MSDNIGRELGYNSVVKVKRNIVSNNIGRELRV